MTATSTATSHDTAGPRGFLELIGLSRRFGPVVALDDLTFSVPPGQVFGFLGPNGAGKTTTMRAIFGVVALEAGEVRWQGRPVTEQARHRFGYMPEERGLYPSMPVLEQLKYLGRLHDVGTVILPVQIPLIIAYALSYTVIYANGANAFYRVLGFLPPTAPVAMPVLYAAGDVPAWQAAVSAVLVAVGTVWMARTAATIYGRSILRTGSRVRLRQVLARGEAV